MACCSYCARAASRLLLERSCTGDIFLSPRTRDWPLWRHGNSLLSGPHSPSDTPASAGCGLLFASVTAVALCSGRLAKPGHVCLECNARCLRRRLPTVSARELCSSSNQGQICDRPRILRWNTPRALSPSTEGSRKTPRTEVHFTSRNVYVVPRLVPESTTIRPRKAPVKAPETRPAAPEVAALGLL